MTISGFKWQLNLSTVGATGPLYLFYGVNKYILLCGLQFSDFTKLKIHFVNSAVVASSVFFMFDCVCE